MEEVEKNIGPRGLATRAKILDAARQCFIIANGHIDMASVAKTSSTSMGLLYRYFDSKGALQAATMREFYDKVARLIFEPVESEHDWIMREIRRVELTIAFYYSDPMARVVVAGRSWETEAEKVVKDNASRNAALLAASLTRGQDLGFVRQDLDLDITPFFIVGSMEQAIRLLVADDTLNTGQMTRVLLDIIGRMMLIDPSEMTARLDARTYDFSKEELHEAKVEAGLAHNHLD